MSFWRGMKGAIADVVLDGPRYGSVVRFPVIGKLWGRTWIDLKNRGERLIRRVDQRGVECQARWTSDLFYCLKHPLVGRRLMDRALAEWPVEFHDGPATNVKNPRVSFVICHRGTSRLPQLLSTIRAIAAQREVAIECLVVEQSPSCEIKDALPDWVRHIHSPPPRPDMAFSRSWAFNVGARAALGKIVVCHDNDICPPRDYALELTKLFDRGFQAARLQRFVFYLSELLTADVFSGRWRESVASPLAVVQNCEGHTIAVDKEAYFDLGGHDEGFLGWGGEDNEFLDRCRSLRFHSCAYLPFLHLYHAPQPGKSSVHPNTEYFEERMRVPASVRASELRIRPMGSLAGPNLQARPEFREFDFQAGRSPIQSS